ncbi:MAG: hypothetical protein P4L84_06855 [Isosphaeraceae bacterium]|nr:hypothetical protein [Isosphaeraceae bacterium]
MNKTVQLGVAVGMLLAFSSAEGATVVYDFSGVLAQPVDGSSSFSGQFFYDSNLPSSLLTQHWSTPSDTYANYDSGLQNQGNATADTSMGITVTVGGHTFPVANATTDSNLTIDTTPSSSFFSIGLSHTGTQISQYLGLGISLVNNKNQVFINANPPSDLQLGDFQGGSLDLKIGEATQIVGFLTDLNRVQPAKVPEPASLAVFALLGVGLAFGKSRIAGSTGNRTSPRTQLDR